MISCKPQIQAIYNKAPHGGLHNKAIIQQIFFCSRRSLLYPLMFDKFFMAYSVGRRPATEDFHVYHALILLAYHRD